MNIRACYDRYEDGQKSGRILSWMQAKYSEKDIKSLVESVWEHTVSHWREWYSQTHSDVSPHSIVFCSRGWITIVPENFEDAQDKEVFFEACNSIIKDICKEFKDPPVMATFVSSVWISRMNKSFHDKMMRELSHYNFSSQKISELQKDLHDSIIKIECEGSVSKIPPNHPVLSKVDALMFTAHFLTMDGPVAVTCCEPCDEDDTTIPDTSMMYNVNRFPSTNRVNFDVRDYVPVPFSEA